MSNVVSMFGTLPAVRREELDGWLRRAVGETRALAVEHAEFAEHYRAIRSCLEGCVDLLDKIEALS